jgi:hypothetical protein
LTHVLSIKTCIDRRDEFEVTRGNRIRCPECIKLKVNPNKSPPNTICPRCRKLHYVKGASMKDRLYCDACKNLVKTVFSVIR